MAKATFRDLTGRYHVTIDVTDWLRDATEAELACLIVGGMKTFDRHHSLMVFGFSSNKDVRSFLLLQWRKACADGAHNTVVELDRHTVMPWLKDNRPGLWLYWLCRHSSVVIDRDATGWFWRDHHGAPKDGQTGFASLSAAAKSAAATLRLEEMLESPSSF